MLKKFTEKLVNVLPFKDREPIQYPDIQLKNQNQKRIYERKTRNEARKAAYWLLVHQ